MFPLDGQKVYLTVQRLLTQTKITILMLEVVSMGQQA
jgi:hypothetical protein